MITIKFTFSNGSSKITPFQGTLSEAKQSYFGKLMVIDETNNIIQRCICVHPA